MKGILGGGSPDRNAPTGAGGGGGGCGGETPGSSDDEEGEAGVPGGGLSVAAAVAAAAVGDGSGMGASGSGWVPKGLDGGVPASPPSPLGMSQGSSGEFFYCFHLCLLSFLKCFWGGFSYMFNVFKMYMDIYCVWYLSIFRSDAYSVCPNVYLGSRRRRRTTRTSARLPNYNPGLGDDLHITFGLFNLFCGVFLLCS